MKWYRILGVAALLAAWSLMAWWQYREYVQECKAAREGVRSQAESLIHAMVGGIESHPRIGYFYKEQIQGILNEFVESRDVLAVAITTENGHVALSAGEASLLHLDKTIPAGGSWEDTGYRLAKDFRIPAVTGGGGGGGGGGGRGLGRGRGLERPPDGEANTDFPPGGVGTAILLIDRTRADQQQQRAATSRLLLTLAGSSALGAVALAWRATVRLTASQGRNRVLEAEARHLRELGQAAAGLAHETRGPLGLIRGWTQRLSESEFKSPEQRTHACAVVEECDRVTARINQFLAFARPSPPKPDRVDLNALLEELRVVLEPDLEGKGLKLTIDAKAMIYADREMLRQALFNLAQNALQAAPDGTAIDVTFRRQTGNRGVLDLADRGSGVPADAVASLFTPYFTTRADGHGLGLAIVRRIAAAHDWQACYVPREGGGAIFRLEGIKYEL